MIRLLAILLLFLANPAFAYEPRTMIEKAGMLASRYESQRFILQRCQYVSNIAEEVLKENEAANKRVVEAIYERVAQEARIKEKKYWDSEDVRSFVMDFTISEANKILNRADAIHGNRAQSCRQLALDFRKNLNLFDCCFDEIRAVLGTSAYLYRIY